MSWLWILTCLPSMEVWSPIDSHPATIKCSTPSVPSEDDAVVKVINLDCLLVTDCIDITMDDNPEVFNLDCNDVTNFVWHQEELHLGLLYRYPGVECKLLTVTQVCVWMIACHLIINVRMEVPSDTCWAPNAHRTRTRSRARPTSLSSYLYRCSCLFFPLPQCTYVVSMPTQECVIVKSRHPININS